MKSIKLNLGCGSDYRKGYVNVDHAGAITPKDMVADLSVTPWPFADGSVDEVVMMDCLEHLSDPHGKILEVARILKSSGKFFVHVPYAKSDGAFQCPEHKSFFTEKSFDYFCGVSGYDAFGNAPFKLEYVRLTQTTNTWKCKLICLIPFRKLLRHFLWNMFDGVEAVMIKK